MNTTYENCTLLDTKIWFEKAVPSPQSKNFHTQLGVHCEEVNEMLVEVTALNPMADRLLDRAKRAMHELASYLKANDHVVAIHPENEVNFLDALCDQIVTATGVSHMRGHEIIGAMTEVNASNFSKFVNGRPIFDDNKKVKKGPHYFKANLAPFLPH